MWPLALLAACDPLPVEVGLHGRVMDGRAEDASGVASATVSVRDAGTAPFSETEADGDGAFSVMVPASQPFYLALGGPAGDDTASGDDWVPTAFAGLAGDVDITAEDGQLWLRSAADVEDLREEFGACETGGDDGGIVEGEVRLYIAGQEPGDLPFVTTAWVTAYEQDGTEHGACYLDDEGASDPEATRTGESGRFAVFGVPEGPTTVVVAYEFSTDTQPTVTYYVWLPGDGVAPYYPAYVESP